MIKVNSCLFNQHNAYCIIVITKIDLLLIIESFIVYCHINSDDDQLQLVKILDLDILSMKLKYFSQNTLYH